MKTFSWLSLYFESRNYCPTALSITLLFAAQPLWAENPACGQPLVAARLDALKLPSAVPTGPQTVGEYLPMISRTNLEELRAAVGKSSGTEAAILKKIRKMWPPFETHRISATVLRKVLQSGGILSYRELEKRGIKTDPPYTPRLEDELFGGYDCIFTSVGPPAGRGKYGEILLTIRPHDRPGSWASASSGWRYMKDYRNALSRESTRIGPDEILAFSHTIFVHADWAQAYPLLIAMHIRSKPPAEQAELSALLLGEKDRRTFWQLIDDRWLGYMEGKQGGELMIKDIETIEVPPGNYEEILSWTNAPRDKIRKLPAQPAQAPKL